MINSCTRERWRPATIPGTLCPTLFEQCVDSFTCHKVTKTEELRDGVYGISSLSKNGCLIPTSNLIVTAAKSSSTISKTNFHLHLSVVFWHLVFLPSTKHNNKFKRQCLKTGSWLACFYHITKTYKGSLKHKSCFCQVQLCDHHFASGYFGYFVSLKMVSCSTILFFLVDFPRSLYLLRGV